MREKNGIFAVFVSMATVLVGSVLIIFLMGQFTLEKSQEVVNRQILLEKVHDLLSTLKDAETGQRGYLLTGEEEYLQPYNQAIGLVHKRLDDLGQYAQNGDISRENVETLARLANLKLDELSRTIALRREQGFDAAMKVVNSDAGQQWMQQLREHANRIAQEEQTQLQRAHAQADTITRYRTLVFILAIVGNLAFLAWCFRRIQREMANRQAATAEAHRQRNLMSVTLASIGDAVIVTDTSARITFMNPVAQELTGWKLDEAQGLPLSRVFKILNEMTRQPVESPVEKVLRLGTVVGLANHTILVRKDGSEVPIDDSGAPIRETDGPTQGVVLVFRDFTEYKESQRQLQEAKDLAEAANRAKDRFMATLSHELRTPLTPVLATLTNWELSATEIPEPFRQEVLMLRRNVELEARLIDDLLDLTRVAKGKLQLNPEVLDLHELLKAVSDICMSEIHAKRIKFDVTMSATRHHVKADSARMQQVFWNILRNAAKFTPEGGWVRIQTSDGPDGRIRVTISDSGIGMSRDTMERIFTPFEQGEGDGKVTRQYGGLGLGMAISKALLDVQGGTIEPQSDGAGKGATFVVTMPAVEPRLRSTAPAAPAGRSGAATPCNILLVEDHIDTARTMSRLLRAWGHQVKTANSLAAAIEIVDAESFDLVLSDIGLPDGTGIDLIRHVRRGSDVPAIALTGFGMEEDIAKCREAGFTAHLTKPINFQKLAHAIEAAAAASRTVGAEGAD